MLGVPKAVHSNEDAKRNAESRLPVELLWGVREAGTHRRETRENFETINYGGRTSIQTHKHISTPAWSRKRVFFIFFLRSARDSQRFHQGRKKSSSRECRRNLERDFQRSFLARNISPEQFIVVSSGISYPLSSYNSSGRLWGTRSANLFAMNKQINLSEELVSMKICRQCLKPTRGRHRSKTTKKKLTNSMARSSGKRGVRRSFGPRIEIICEQTCTASFGKDTSETASMATKSLLLWENDEVRGFK